MTHRNRGLPDNTRQPGSCQERSPCGWQNVGRVHDQSNARRLLDPSIGTLAGSEKDETQVAVADIFDTRQPVYELVGRIFGVHSRLLTALSLSEASDAELGGYATGSRLREAYSTSEWNGRLIPGYASGRAAS